MCLSQQKTYQAKKKNKKKNQNDNKPFTNQKANQTLNQKTTPPHKKTPAIIHSPDKKLTPPLTKNNKSAYNKPYQHWRNKTLPNQKKPKPQIKKT